MDDIKKELGFRIKKVYEEGSTLVVEVDTPEPDTSVRNFKFSNTDFMKSEKKYVREGEIREAPRWKIRVENILREESQENESDNQELEKHEGEKLEV